jgi:demethylmenaquinone methyltransferase/2-methoxy-6-polyprenyl-1,4-benzoquinol methylase
MQQNKEEGKKEQVRNMFNNISGKYDFLNHFLSMGIDILWRKKMIRKIGEFEPKLILDVATGTGDLAIEVLKINPDQVIGVDISEGMLEVGKEKISKRKLDNKIKLQIGDSENLPFDENKFDAIMVAFGVRNFENLDNGLADMYRVLNKDGWIWILEFSKPKKFLIKQLYNFYFKNILPLLGRMISKDDFAYTYLPNSVREFPDGSNFLNHLKKAGFSDLKLFPLSFGIATIYCAKK